MKNSSRSTTKNSSDQLSTIEVIFFDAGNTLLKARPSVGSIYQKTASKYGVTPSVSELEESFRRQWKESKLSGDFLAESAGKGQQVEKIWWKKFVRGVFKEFDPIENFDAFFDELYDTFAQPSSWELFPEVIEVLSELLSRGFRLGLISNWDSRLPGILSGLEIDHFFSEIVVSSLVELEKPDRRIFLLSAGRMNVPVEKAAHVGDDPLLDYKGAQEAGLLPFLVDRTGDGHRDMRTIRSLQQLIR